MISQHQTDTMKIEGLFINKSKTKFKKGQAFLFIQNEKGRDIGILNIKSIGLAEHFKIMNKTRQKIKLNLEEQNPWKEEIVKQE